MGSIEDSRKAVQDFIAPDLKALAARLEALEKEMHTEFDHAEKKMEGQFAHAEKMSLERFASVEKLAGMRQEALLATIATNHANVMNAVEMEKRLSRLESERKAELPHA